jgi:hypothetical protein
MTPKEKAEELFKKYEDCHPKNYDKRGRNFFTDQIKISALIAVDEILKLASFYNDTQGEVTYWQEVKQEINNL